MRRRLLAAAAGTQRAADQRGCQRKLGDARRRVKSIERFFSELRGYSAERVAEIGADEGEGSDCGDCDQCGDQSIFDGCNPGLVPDQVGKNGAQAASPQVSEVIARKLHRIV
jgi:hypothetical protein